MVRLSPEELARNRQRIAEEIQPFARKQKAPRLVADLTPEGLADALTEAALQRQNWVAAYDELPALDPARVAEILVAIDHSSPVSEILASSKDPRDQMVLCLQAELASAIEKIVEQRRQMQRGIR